MHIFSGLYKSRKIQAPKGMKTRPTSGRLREALFNICQGFIEDAAFLDLFAGSGAMGLEALSRGARTATFIDNSKESIICIQANLRNLQLQNVSEVIYGDVFMMMKKLSKQKRTFDIIYADPPYDTMEEGLLAYSASVLAMIDEGSFLEDGGALFIEDSVDSMPQSVPLKHLALKSSRRMGRSALHYYVYTSNNRSH
jgi:16S rRNA (guanine966-N2)-methyltransferase